MVMNNIEYRHKGLYFRPLSGERSNQWGEAVYFLDWGGIILEFKDGAKITYARSDLEDDRDDTGPGEDAIRTWDGSYQVF